MLGFAAVWQFQENQSPVSRITTQLILIVCAPRRLISLDFDTQAGLFLAQPNWLSGPRAGCPTERPSGT